MGKHKLEGVSSVSEPRERPLCSLATGDLACMDSLSYMRPRRQLRELTCLASFQIWDMEEKILHWISFLSLPLCAAFYAVLCFYF